MDVLPHQTLLTNVIRNVNQAWRNTETTHDVHAWQPNGHKLTNSVAGLSYMLTTAERDLSGYRFKIDGSELPGDEVKAWAETHIPQSLAIARDVREEYSKVASRSGSVTGRGLTTPPLRGGWPRPTHQE